MTDQQLQQLESAAQLQRKAREGFGSYNDAGACRAAANLDLTALAEELRQLREENAGLRRVHSDLYLAEGGWIYQGDDEDHLESLVCPVLIRPQQLMGLLEEIERLRSEKGDWYIVNHDKGDEPMRGPFPSQEAAGAVRDEMWRQERFEEINLWLKRL